MSKSPSNEYNNNKINQMVQNYKDDIILDQINTYLKTVNTKNRKKCVQECKELIKQVKNTETKKCIRTLDILKDIEFENIPSQQNSEKKIVVVKPVHIIHTFDEWIINNTELKVFMNTSNTYSQGEQILYGKQLITEYTKYVNHCSKQLIIPTPFPNIEIFNRLCKSITLENGRVIKNPNYSPDYNESSCFCCFP